MAKYTFDCLCGFKFECIRSEPPKVVKCPTCGANMTRQSGLPTARLVEILDNGSMTRRVERPANAEKLYKERAVQSELDKHKL